jgi:FlaA1/EpsC-like NDP-sugar epimerase
VDIAHLLGRAPIVTDTDGSYLAGRRVLVTGAGGSIGSELCRQIIAWHPSELIMLDRDESALHAVQLSLRGRALLDDPSVVLADIRDRRNILNVFRERQPEIVFHAAALKHQPLLEQYPGEAVKVNVWGTATVLRAAADCGAEMLVNISTDKAADPTCVLGGSKRLAERLTAWHAPRRCLSVRFGNVLGSRGSVLDAFRAQAVAGLPLTVTHPDVTRYFMTVDEAVRLTVHAGAIGHPGEVLVLDMGEPVRIADLARRRFPGAILSYTGLRPGEKLHEDLLGSGEVDVRPTHPLIMQVPVLSMGPDDTAMIDVFAGRERVAAEIMDLCGRGAGCLSPC